MEQEKNMTATTPAQPQSVITMQDICNRFGISTRYCRTLFRRGVIEGRPRYFRKRPKSNEHRAIDWFITRAEFRRLEREGLVPGDFWDTDARDRAKGGEL